jgi:hypothetical protein
VAKTYFEVGGYQAVMLVLDLSNPKSGSRSIHYLDWLFRSQDPEMSQISQILIVGNK